MMEGYHDIITRCKKITHNFNTYHRCSSCKKGAYSGRRKILVEFNKEKVEDVDSKYNSLGNQGDKETAEIFSTLRYTKEPLLVEGRLDVGIKVDESNYKTMFRLYDATFTPI